MCLRFANLRKVGRRHPTFLSPSASSGRHRLPGQKIGAAAPLFPVREGSRTATIAVLTDQGRSSSCKVALRVARSLFELQDVRSVATNAVKPHLNHPSILLSDGFRSLPERGFSTDTQVPKDRHQTTVLQLAKRRLFAIPELGNGGGTVLQVLIHESEDK